MKKIGIVGGMAIESTSEFYRRLGDLARGKLSGGEFPEIIIYSLNMAEFRKPLKSGDYQGAISLISDKLQSLCDAGADFAFIASNTPHIFFEEISEKSPIPLLSIVEMTAQEASRREFERVGLFGTKFTMEGDFFEEKFEEYGISVVSPEAEEREYIHEKTMGELPEGKFVKRTQEKLIRIGKEMAQEKDIQALILGSTELPIVLNEEVLNMPTLDTTEICARGVFDYAQE